MTNRNHEHDLHFGDRVTTRPRLVPDRLARATSVVDAVWPGDHGLDTIDLLANDGTIVSVSHLTRGPSVTPPPPGQGQAGAA